jgi:hypothetical protein
MWEKLVELVVGKALDRVFRQRTPREQLAKAVVKLLTAMDTCHETYTSYNSNSTAFRSDKDKLRERWFGALLEMGESIGELRSVFEIHDLELGQIVGDYFWKEKPSTSTPAIKYDIAEGILEKIPHPAQSLTEDTQSADFDLAITKLKDFIRDTLKLTPEEILIAQKSIR